MYKILVVDIIIMDIMMPELDGFSSCRKIREFSKTSVLMKFQTGVQKLNIKRFDLTNLINNILKRYTKLIQQEGYKIIFEYDSSAEVLGDELKIS